MRKRSWREWALSKPQERQRESARFADQIHYLAIEGVIPQAVAERIVRHPAIAVKTLVAALDKPSKGREQAFLNLIDLVGTLGGPVARRSLLRLLEKVRGRWADSVTLNALNNVGTRSPREVERLFRVLHDGRFTARGRATAYEGLLDRIPLKRRKSYMKRLLASLHSPNVRDHAEIWEVVVRWRKDLPLLPECRSRLETLFGPLPWEESDDAY